jgi:hypothetical protein
MCGTCVGSWLGYIVAELRAASRYIEAEAGEGVGVMVDSSEEPLGSSGERLDFSGDSGDRSMELSDEQGRTYRAGVDDCAPKLRTVSAMRHWSVALGTDGVVGEDLVIGTGCTSETYGTMVVQVGGTSGTYRTMVVQVGGTSGTYRTMVVQVGGTSETYGTMAVQVGGRPTAVGAW